MTGTPFGDQPALGLNARSHAEALRIKDVRVGQIWPFEVDALGVKRHQVVLIRPDRRLEVLILSLNAVCANYRGAVHLGRSTALGCRVAGARKGHSRKAFRMKRSALPFVSGLYGLVRV